MTGGRKMKWASGLLQAKLQQIRGSCANLSLQTCLHLNILALAVALHRQSIFQADSTQDFGGWGEVDLALYISDTWCLHAVKGDGQCFLDVSLYVKMLSILFANLLLLFTLPMMHTKEKCTTKLFPECICAYV